MFKSIGLLSPVIVPLILSGILFLSSERNNKPKLFLAIYMLVIAFVFGANYYYFSHEYIVYSYFHSLHIASVLLIYPGAYVYVKLLIEPNIKTRKLLIHLYPSLFFLLSSALVFFPFLSASERIYFLTEYRFHPDFSDKWLKLLYYIRIANILTLFIQVFLYSGLIFKSLRKHKREMSNLFSNPEKFQLSWLKMFNVALAMSAFISVFLYTVNPVKLFGDERFLSYPLLLIALILWFLGIMGNNQNYFSVQLNVTPDRNDLNNGSKDFEKLNMALINYIKIEKAYLNPDLKIWDVSTKLGTNRTYISKLINSRYKQSFSSFVNSYRVEEAKRLIDLDPSQTLAQICEASGFGSLPSLSRTFCDFYGVKITQYRKTLIL